MSASTGYCANCVERCEGQHGPCFSEEIGCTEDFRPDDVDATPYAAPVHVVTICGSTRFRAEMAEANRRLTMGGHIVLAPGVFQHDGDEITDAQKAALDRLHLSKIDMAGWVYVVNPGGYIGDSTRREIAYAESIDKPVQYLVPVATAFNPAYRVARCGQQSSHGPHVMEHGPDRPRNCPGNTGSKPGGTP
jgi:hypothetical protein